MSVGSVFIHMLLPLVILYSSVAAEPPPGQRPACVFTDAASGATYDLTALGPFYAKGPGGATRFFYVADVCAALPAALAGSQCPPGAANAFQLRSVPEPESCYPLGGGDSGPPPAFSALSDSLGVGVLIATTATSCAGFQRSLRVRIECAAEEGRPAAVSEGPEPCLYRINVSAPAGCPLVCTRDSANAVCGGSARGECTARGCACAAGFFGPSCTARAPPLEQHPALVAALCLLAALIAIWIFITKTGLCVKSQGNAARALPLVVLVVVVVLSLVLLAAPFSVASSSLAAYIVARRTPPSPPPLVGEPPLPLECSAARARAPPTAPLFSDRLIFPPPLGAPAAPAAPPTCGPRDLLRAVQQGHSSGADSAFHLGDAGGCSGRMDPTGLPLLRWRAAREACDLLQRAGFLFMHGDSLVRHLAQTLIALLAAGDGGDVERALDLRADASAIGSHPCTCNDAYLDRDPNPEPSGNPDKPKNKYCRAHSLAYAAGAPSSEAEAGNAPPPPLSVEAFRARAPQFCPTWTRWHVCFDCTEELPESGILYMSGGYHAEALTMSRVSRFFETSLTAKGLGFPFTRYKHVCGLLPAVGINKAYEYTKRFGTPHVLAYNRFVQLFCRGEGGAVQDNYTPTVNASSSDGVHYLMGANMVLVQLLLNMIAVMLQ